MTEKSEDQVIKFCIDCYAAGNVNDELMHVPNCEMRMVEYIPHSKYLALKSDLAVAVVALKEIRSHVDYAYKENINMYGAIKLAAKEALGKIVGKE